jgi:hypothetical protein
LSTTNVYGLAASAWVHVAYVADDVTGYGTFYIDGKPEIPVRISGQVVQPSRDHLRVGSVDTNGTYDIDEFRFRLGTTTAAEIKSWASQNPAADGAYGQGGYPKGRLVLLDSNSDTQGPPRMGNAGYALELYGLAGSGYILTLGTNRLRFGALPLPLDLGFLDPALKGVGFESSADLAWLQGTIGAVGKASVPLPIPNVPSLNGFTVYSQAVLYSPALKRWMASNAFATAIGR